MVEREHEGIQEGAVPVKYDQVIDLQARRGVSHLHDEHAAAA